MQDWMPVVACFCLVLSCVGWLFYSFDTRSDSNIRDGEIALGKIQHKTANVKLRPPKSFLWSEVKQSSNFYVQDSIQTGHESTAYLVFNNGSSLQMGPESLIYLNNQKGKLELDIAEGDLFLKGSFEAKVAGKSVSSSSSDSQVKISQTRNGSLKIQPHVGKVNIQSAGMAQEIKEGQAIEVQADNQFKVQELDFIFETPLAHSLFEKENKKQNVEFKINSTRKIQGPYFLELTKNSKPRSHPPKVVLWEDTTSPLSVSLEEGFWNARILRKDKLSVASTIQKFQTKKLPSLAWKNVAGQPSYNVKVYKKRLSYFLSWTAIPRAVQYKVSLLDKDGDAIHTSITANSYLRRNKEFSKLLIEDWKRSKKSSNIRSPASESTSHSWAVKVEALDRQDNSIVAPFLSELKLVDERPAPRIASSIMSEINLKDKTLTYSVSTQDKVLKGTKTIYNIMGKQIESDSLSFSIPMSRLLLHAKNYGPTFKVFLKNLNGKKSKQSTVHINPAEVSFPELIAKKPQLIYPSRNSRIIYGQTAQLQWESVKNSFYQPMSYKIELTELSKNETSEFNSKTASFSLSNLEPALYSWKITSIWPEEFESPSSAEYRFEILAPKIFEAPTPIRSPAEEESSQ